MLFEKIPCENCIVKATCMITILSHLTRYRGKIVTMNNKAITIQRNINLADITYSRVDLLCTLLSSFLHPALTIIAKHRAKRFLKYVHKQAEKYGSSL